MPLGTTRMRRWSPRTAGLLALLAVTVAAVVAALASQGGGSPAARAVPAAATRAQPSPPTVAASADVAATTAAPGAAAPTTKAPSATAPSATAPSAGRARARLRLRPLVRRRARPPLLRLRASGAGRVTVRWTSGGRRGHATLHVLAPGTRRVALANLPPRWRHAIRVRATLHPRGGGRRARAHARYPRPGR